MVVVVNRIALNIGVPVPTLWISRPTAGLIRVRRHKPAIRRRIVALIHMINSNQQVSLFCDFTAYPPASGLVDVALRALNSCPLASLDVYRFKCSVIRIA